MPALRSCDHDVVAVAGLEQIVQPDDEDEPAHVRVVLQGRQDQIAVGHQPFDVELGDAPAGFEDLFEPADLGDAEGGVDFAQAIVVAEPLVREPGHSFAALVAQGAAGRWRSYRRR